MLQTIITARQTCLRLPNALSDAELLWLSAHNASVSFEQTADGLLIMTRPNLITRNRGEIGLIPQLKTWNDRLCFGEIRGISGGVLLPEGGQYQADGFIISAAAWETIPESQRDDGCPPVLPTAAFELVSPANVTATGYT